MPRLLWPLVMMSGASALIYEVVWLRRAALHLGATGTALGVVISTFLGGLALGAALGGRWADRHPARLILGYAGVEAFIAVSGLLVGPLLEWLTPLLGGLYRSGGDGAILFNAGRALVCVLVLLPPATAMGATLPILARHAAATSADAASSTGAIYAANTFGAVAGSFAAGWVLIPRFGLTGATLVAVGANLMVAGGAFLISRKPALPSAAESDSPYEPAPRWVFPAYAVSGFAALVGEVCWTRGLVLAFGSSVYAFSLVLGSFILGLAVGGAVSSRVLPAIRNPGAAFAALLTACGLLTMLTVPALQRLPIGMMRVWGSPETRFGDVVLAQFSLAALVVAVPAMTMGAMFPILCRLAMGSKPAAGRAIGKLAAWNTAGNIAGTLAASFLFVPLLGVDRALLAAAATSLVLAAVVLVCAGPRKLAVVPILAAALVFAVPRWELALMTSTPAVYARTHLDNSRRYEMSLSEMLRTGEILFSRWDSTGLVTVHRRDTTLSLRVNGKTEASSRGDMLTQILTSHIPLMAHEAPRDVFLVGYGSGATASAALKHDIASLECVEISPAMLEAAELFADLLDRPRLDARLKVMVGDARAHLRHSGRAYDVIIAQPSNLWISGTATLFTREHFARSRERLKPGGVMCQWLHAYRLPPEDFRAVVATFREVFPETELWEVTIAGDYLLLGSATPIPALRRERYENVKGALRKQGVFHLEGLMRARVAGTDGVARLGAGARIITDDDCHVEYSAPRGLVAPDTSEVLDSIAPVREDEIRGLIAGAVRAARDGRVLDSLAKLNKGLPYAAFDPALLGAIEAVCRPAFRRAMDEAGANRALACKILKAIPADAEDYEPAQVWLQRLEEK